MGFSYDDEQVLHDVSFTAREGEVTALVGPSGSGKSTCARLAARLLETSEGTITVGGVDISTADPEVLLGDYSMVFQDVTLFDDTVIENIRLGRHGATDAETLAAAAAADCDEFVQNLPQGYGTPIGENGARLSGGERQRISIARALLKNAPIIAHRMRTVENADKVVVLSRGRVVEEGSPRDLRARKDGIFARMCALQSASASWSLKHN